MTREADGRLLADIAHLPSSATVETVVVENLRLLIELERHGLRPGDTIPAPTPSTETLEQAQSHRDAWRTAGIAAAGRLEQLEDEVQELRLRLAVMVAVDEIRSDDVAKLSLDLYLDSEPEPIKTPRRVN